MIRSYDLSLARSLPINSRNPSPPREYELFRTASPASCHWSTSTGQTFRVLWLETQPECPLMIARSLCSNGLMLACWGTAKTMISLFPQCLKKYPYPVQSSSKQKPYLGGVLYSVGSLLISRNFFNFLLSKEWVGGGNLRELYTKLVPIPVCEHLLSPIPKRKRRWLSWIRRLRKFGY